uniref:ILEI/PANDER domain-containing protein n=1 Tax=Oryzias latipes TaxID=8090 RepID=A0A3P9L088_ORYLA
MLSIKVGNKMGRKNSNYGRWILRASMVLLPVLIIVIVLLQLNTNPLKGLSSADLEFAGEPTNKHVKKSAGPCSPRKECPEDHFSFIVQSGAANVVAPKICIENDLVLGTVLNNVGIGINTVLVDGKTGKVLKTTNFDTYSGDVKYIIDFLKEMKPGSVILMASFDEPSSKLNDEARNLIAELGSSSIQKLGYRDNWVFVGAKGGMVKSNFEKYIKNDKPNNKYDNWPELIDLQGCFPKTLE